MRDYPLRNRKRKSNHDNSDDERNHRNKSYIKKNKYDEYDEDDDNNYDDDDDSEYEESEEDNDNDDNDEFYESNEDEDDDDDVDDEDEEYRVTKQKKKSKSKLCKSNETDEKEKEKEIRVKKTKTPKSVNNNYSIILVNDEDDWMDDENDEDDDYSTENEDDPITDTDTEEENPSSPKHEINTPILSQLKELLSQNPKDKSIQKCIDSYESDIRKKDRKERERNCRIFNHIIKEKQQFNDYDFFQTMDVSAQKKIIKELKLINESRKHEKPFRLSILEKDIPLEFKATALAKVNCLQSMDPSSGEYYKIKSWIDQFMRIPFGQYTRLPVGMNDGVEKCHEFMENAQRILNEKVYGLNDAKMQIMQFLGQLVTNPNGIGCAIGIQGPPGTGKTSLAQNALSEILCKPFSFIDLGGAKDSSLLDGFGYTYEGSTYGKIVQILIESKCMNPIIYFDELDKISESVYGQEIVGILTHLIDSTQNSHFHDKYFAELSFDLSKCLFVFSYNDESKINPVLKDRMYRIQTNGYNLKQKTIISSNYLLPKIRDQLRFSAEDIIIQEPILHYIIESFCKEDGVRNLKRSLEIIFTKLNLYRLMKPESNLFEESMNLRVSFPFVVTREVVDKLIKKPEINQSFYMLYS
jgi:ATP-dependent Lon protease